jgi:protein-S-isoprenylcysteine O-methyltransferase Ste14
MSLKTRIVLRFTVGLPLVLLLLFLPAGSWRFWQGWTFLAVTFIPGVLTFIYFYRRDPKVVERRLQSREKIGEQQWIVRSLKLVAFLAFLLPGLDYRFGWSRSVLEPMPLWLMVVAHAAILGAFLMVVWVMAVNRFASRTIQVEANQPVISSGPYHIVRHPIYAASLIMWLAIPVALGSYVALPVFVLMIPVYVLRLLNEEKVLRRDLSGYSEYCVTTPFRLVPHVW